LTLCLVRHGRTVYNAAGLMQGWCDSPLTRDGRAEVLAMAGALAGRPFAAAYSSPSGRAVATAQHLLTHHPDVPLTCDDDLMEFHFGDDETRPHADVFATVDARTMFAELFAGRHPGFPGAAEDLAGYLGRVQAAFARIEAAHPDGEEVLVVSHGVTLLTYLRTVVNAPITPLDNATLTVVTIDPAGGRELVALNLGPVEAAALSCPV
jgi:probable phosphoglycerate mutase